jgi:hypothetical protein
VTSERTRAAYFVASSVMLEEFHESCKSSDMYKTLSTTVHLHSESWRCRKVLGCPSSPGRRDSLLRVSEL